MHCHLPKKIWLDPYRADLDGEAKFADEKNQAGMAKKSFYKILRLGLISSCVARSKS